MTLLHSNVKRIAKNQPALVFSSIALRGLLLTNFTDSVQRLKSYSVPIEGYPNIEARFIGISVDTYNFSVTLSTNSGDIIKAEITPGFQATIALHIANKPSDEFSRIEIDVSFLNVNLSADAPNLVLGEPDFEVSGNVVPSSTRSVALNVPGINKEDVERVEGAMGYVMPRRIVASVFTSIESIDISKHFTAFELHGIWKLHVVNEGLVIIPANGITIREDTGCPLRDSVPDLSISSGTRIDVDDTHYSWSISPRNFPPYTVRSATDKDGFASLYAPTPVWDTKFSKFMPSINYNERNNGFIGYDLIFSASLKYAGLRIDPVRFGIVIDLEIIANGSAFLTVNVPCVGRSDLAYARFSCAPSSLSIHLSFVRTEAGKLVLESQIDNLSIGDVEANVSGFSRWLAIAGGKAAVVGFIIDYILKRVIENNIPIVLHRAIKQEVNSKNFELLDFEQLAGFTRYQKFTDVTFSGDTDSVLVGLTSDG